MVSLSSLLHQYIFARSPQHRALATTRTCVCMREPLSYTNSGNCRNLRDPDARVPFNSPPQSAAAERSFTANGTDNSSPHSTNLGHTQDYRDYRRQTKIAKERIYTTCIILFWIYREVQRLALCVLCVYTTL